MTGTRSGRINIGETIDPLSLVEDLRAENEGRLRGGEVTKDFSR